MTTVYPMLNDLGDDAATLPGLTRIETHPRPVAEPIVAERIRSVYPHDAIYGDFCPVQGYVDAPPRPLYEWLADTRALSEWTYGLRDFTTTDEPGLWHAYDRLGEDTEIYVRTECDPHVMTVDYHCAWDQGQHLWMIYLMRVVDAQIVLNKPGSVVLWNNCRHPFYDENPFPELAPPAREEWVGDHWGMFNIGHQIELDNITAIAEYRHSHGLPLTPEWMSR
ncbi:SRPBCC family protein [Gordonia sp. ABSL1-1]|uniref:SRPBCC family protein n=1 Tax=Gordonia sp. ABSL1-1 TaxID=3053923 RepID=UPI002573846B|nr:SRPBCC family protein [Gordonia sp. ABSL1-1]MDL9937985.1 SRPBCC family protein [Gordonia sp. ABSL1-1]